MANANTLYFGGSYDGRPEANKEDILDLISNISPMKTPLLSGLKRSTATDFVHQVLTDTLAAAASNAAVEGADFTGRALAQPSRVTNYTQIIKKEFAVSGTEQSISHYGFDNRMAYEKEKAMKEWGNDAEFELMRESIVCGASGTARKLNGVKASITTVTSNHSGTTLTEVMLNDKFQAVYNNTDEEINEVYVGPRLKRTISAFTSGTTKFTQADSRGLVNAVDVYDGKPPKLPSLNLSKCWEPLKSLILSSDYGTMRVTIQGMKQWAISRKDSMAGSLESLMEKDLSPFSATPSPMGTYA